MMTYSREFVSLADAAQRLGQSWERTWRQMLRGTLQGEKRDGRWFVDAADLERLMSERAEGERLKRRS